MVSEADAEDYKQQDREDQRREFLEQRSRMGGPEAPEGCEKCDGNGVVYVVNKELVFESSDFYIIPADAIGEARDCYPCLGTGVQP
jgi:hypothetical protein